MADPKRSRWQTDLEPHEAEIVRVALRWMVKRDGSNAAVGRCLGKHIGKPKGLTGQSIGLALTSNSPSLHMAKAVACELNVPWARLSMCDPYVLEQSLNASPMTSPTVLVLGLGASKPSSPEEILRLGDRLYPPPAPAAPPQWEYLTVLLAHLDHESLDEYGKDGWEAVCPLDPWGPGRALLFKRRLLAKSGDGG